MRLGVAVVLGTFLSFGLMALGDDIYRGLSKVSTSIDGINISNMHVTVSKDDE